MGAYDGVMKLLWACVLAGGLLAQAPLKFDAASIREWAPGKRPENITYGMHLEPGRLSNQCASLRVLVFFAFGVTLADKIVGLPSWSQAACGAIANSNTFKVEATMSPSTTPEQVRAMMQSLLAERFSLAAHWTTKEGDVLLLDVGPGGAKIQPWTEQHAAAMKGHKYGCPDDDRQCNNIIAKDSSVSDFANILSSILHRVVLDRTGLAGQYDVSLQWAGDFSQYSSLPSLQAALRDQFGFVLKPGKGPIRTLVIDHVARLKAN